MQTRTHTLALPLDSPPGHQRDSYGDEYTGDFWEDERHGKGVLKYASGDVYEGEFVEGDLKVGGCVAAWGPGI